MKTQTHNKSQYGLEYVSGLLRLESKRNITNISRKTEVNSQNMQHFISNSPWSARELIKGIQQDLRTHSEWQNEAVLVVDESADEKAGEYTAGVARQRNGRTGTVNMCQVGVFLTLATTRVNMWIDGELFLPKNWFAPEQTSKRQKAGISTKRKFQTKPQLAWQMIHTAQQNQIPFVAVAMDDLYGRNCWLRRQLEAANIEYYGDIPENSVVYLEKPKVEQRLRPSGQPYKNPTVTLPKKYHVKELLDHENFKPIFLTLRSSQRGELQAHFARGRVWVMDGHQPRELWLLIRQEEKRVTYALSNASLDTPLLTMAGRKSHRYFVERSNQDAKSELGYDEFQAIKYQAWHHHLALTILAFWFVTSIRLDWINNHPPDSKLLDEFQTDVLPLLSIGNVRELLQATMPIHQLTPKQATELVIEKLINRTRSRRSRLHKKQRKRPQRVT